MEPDKGRVRRLCELAASMGLRVLSVGVSRSGSVYARLVRPWYPDDLGVRVRVSDHLPASGHVSGWVDFRVRTEDGWRRLAEYLAVKTRGRPPSVGLREG